MECTDIICDLITCSMKPLLGYEGWVLLGWYCSKIYLISLNENLHNTTLE